MNTYIAAICVFLLLVIAGCTPSVRYTRDQADRSGSAGRSSGPNQQKAAGGGADSLPSGWETVDGGDAERHQAGWLASTLSEADQGQSFPQNKKNRQDKQDNANGEAPRRLEQTVSTYLGIPYKYGGTTRKGFDCSGFVSAVYLEVYGIQLKRTSGAMWKEGVPVSLIAARPGDLVFFKGGAFGAIDHVGIYMGKTSFVHASNKSGVVYANLKDAYYAKRFAGFRRMF